MPTSDTPSLIDGKPAGQPLVSVIIPAFNAAGFIHKAIESALAQTHHPFEIIVVDDGSSDDTVEVVRRYPVTLIEQKNGGPAAARNTGVQHAGGEWLGFLDHDDIWHVNKTAVQLTYATTGVSAMFSAKDRSVDQFSFEDLYWRNLGGNPSSSMIRRAEVLALDSFDTDRALMGLDDYHFWLKFLFAKYQFKITPVLYDFTPADNHYGGKQDKMLAAELVNIDKISAMAGITPAIVAERKRRLRLAYVPGLIYARDLRTARQQLLALGWDSAALKYWYAFLPAGLIDLKRKLRRAD